MDDLRVPTVPVPAEILCADGSRLTGTVFLPPAASHHDGPTRPEEWINDGRPFFPFLPEERGYDGSWAGTGDPFFDQAWVSSSSSPANGWTHIADLPSAPAAKSPTTRRLQHR